MWRLCKHKEEANDVQKWRFSIHILNSPDRAEMRNIYSSHIFWGSHSVQERADWFLSFYTENKVEKAVSRKAFLDLFMANRVNGSYMNKSDKNHVNMHHGAKRTQWKQTNTNSIMWIYLYSKEGGRHYSKSFHILLNLYKK